MNDVIGYYLDYAGYIHSEQEYFLSMILDPEMAEKQKLFFTEPYAMDVEDVLVEWQRNGLMQITGWIFIFFFCFLFSFHFLFPLSP